VLAYPEQGYSYLVWNDTATNKIYAKNGQTGVVTTNTNAAMLINTCLNALTAGRTWKEKIVVKGNITLSAALNLPSYTIFDVQGYLFIKTDIIALNIVGTVGTHKIFVDVLNAHIYCKVASTAPAIKFDYADQCYINTVWVRGFYYGLKSTNSIINDVYGSTLQYNTIAIDLGSASNAWTFNGCDLSANTGAYSVYIHGLSKGNRFFGCTLEDNGGVGAQLEDQSNNLFKGCYFEGNDNYDVVISETAATQGANSFEDCSFDSSKITGKTGLVAFATSYKDKLINCHFLNGAGYTYTLAAILLDPGAIDSQVIGCNHNAGTGTLAFIRNLGTGTIINQNPTYVTANSGTFSIALHATTATITHGLSYTPAATDITITWTTVGGLLNCTSWSVTGIGAATFTVNLYDANGAAKGPSGTVTGSWAARKTP
jgi:parallel beta-helix repeat protein